MSFARPDLLFLALALPLLLLGMLVLYTRRRRRIARQLADSALLSRLGGSTLLSIPYARSALLMGAATALGLAAAGPQWGRQLATRESEALNVVLALDVSKSMLARDIAPSRLERQRLLVRRLLRELAGDRFGLVVFAGRAYILSPVTIDHSAIELYLDALEPDIVSQGGSSLQSAVLQATDLARGAEDVAGDRVVLLVSDGEALEDVEGIRQAAARAASAGVRIFTVGMATRAGAPVPELDPATGQVLGYKQDETGQQVVSRLGDDLLRGIAERTGGEYLDGSGDVVASLRRALGGLERGQAGAEQRTEPKDRSGLLIAIALLLLAVDVLVSMPRGPRRRRLQPALALIALALIAFGIGDLERGNRHYRAGRYAEAVEAYTAALRSGKGAPQLHYNLGTALLQLGRLDEAEQHLKQALAGVDPDVRQRSQYNLGNRFLAAARQGGEGALAQYEAAVASYKEALRLAPRDPAAKWNLELALRERDEEQRRNPPPMDQQDQEQSPQQQPQQGGGGGGQQPQQSAGEGSESGNASEQQPMSQEQAERILSAAEQDERELARDKLKRGQRRTQVLRDW